MLKSYNTKAKKIKTNISAIILAAGIASRMGRPKQFMLLNNKTVLRHCLDICVKANLKDIVIVANELGKKQLHFQTILPAKLVFNEIPESEMADSVRIGLRATNPCSSGVLICLADHPLVKLETIQMLIRRHELEPHKIIIPVYEAQRGHPTLFPGKIAGEMFRPIEDVDDRDALRKPILRDLIKKDPKRICLLEVDDEGVIIDMDTKQDYRNIVEKF